ncbi:MAG: EAL domain-containing protein [Gammaproteobacteria bacterium]|nr:EAL domain-containing protein [Gammaproteobacteria bacterium]MDP2141464.1 EAL domain-containing protein [Gammaproteobacteria bacterium]MDP2347511.1 EAL domain-containing protein [Gammaproteobacteria bacterium]
MDQDNYINGDDHPVFSASLGYFNGNRFATYGDYRIISAFQPIYSIAHRRIVGLEGLARGIDCNNQQIPPYQLFNLPQSDDIVTLDQICQLVHIENFHALDPPSAWLFLNVDPQTLNRQNNYLRFLSWLLREKKYPANRFVIEVLESTIDDEKELEDHIQEYKKMGFLIAIDDFGAGQSNFERIWRIKPDIVKLDRSMLQKAGTDPSVKSLIKGITSMLHNCKCIVLAEGVETEAEAMAAMEGGVDLVQGFYFAHPFLLSESIKTKGGLWKDLYHSFDELTQRTQQQHQELLAPYIAQFTAATVGAEKKNSMRDISASMLPLKDTIRLYQLALDGSQCYSNIDSTTIHISTKDRLRALADTQGASWKRRDYFFNAVRNPFSIQVTKPYFSISDGTLCITLSVLTEIEGGQFIICCDLLWDETRNSF